MNLIIPMGGQGRRLRPHTLNKAKALLPIAGKTILQRILNEAIKKNKGFTKRITKVGFIVNFITDEINENIEKISKEFNLNYEIFIQKETLGTAHALYQASSMLKDEVLIIFSDTLFSSDLEISPFSDAIIWTKKIENPSAYGVVQLDNRGYISNFIEKPKSYVSNLAVVGIYYFKKGDKLKAAIKQIITSKQKSQGEYQLTDAMKIMIKNNDKFITSEVTDWMDCGNKEEILKTLSKILDNPISKNLISPKSTIHNSIIIPPVYIGQNSIVNNSVIGPYVSVGEKTNIYDSRIQNSIIQNESIIKNINLNEAMLGNHVNFIGKPTNASIGDYSNTIIT